MPAGIRHILGQASAAVNVDTSSHLQKDPMLCRKGKQKQRWSEMLRRCPAVLQLALVRRGPLGKQMLILPAPLSSDKVCSSHLAYGMLSLALSERRDPI